VHTLPLPGMQTDLNSNTKPVLNPQLDFSHPRAAASLRDLTSRQLQFLLRVTPAALLSEREYEIPASVTIAQAILESATAKWGWGSSVLFCLANNPFGIKYFHFPSGDRAVGRSTERTDPASGKSGERVSSGKNLPSSRLANGPTLPVFPSAEHPNAAHPITRSPDHPISPAHPIAASPQRAIGEDYGHFDAPTWEVENGQKKAIIAQFQRFPNLEEAFRAHALLLRGPRYLPAFEVRGDWKQFAERLGPKTSSADKEHCGYSTSPCYSASLIQLVDLYGLNDPSTLAWFATGRPPGDAMQVTGLATRDSGSALEPSAQPPAPSPANSPARKAGA